VRGYSNYCAGCSRLRGIFAEFSAEVVSGHARRFLRYGEQRIR
jgi:hypothetical protein